MKQNGVLMALSSLPSDTGIGNLYESAKEFIDCLKEANVRIWQLLPLNPVGYGSSPYQSECGEAIDPIYISLKYLKDRGLIKTYKKFNQESKRVEYENVRHFKEKYFKEAFKNQKDTEGAEFKKFIKENPWVYQYALFNCLIRKNNYLDWSKWDKEEKYACYAYKKFDDTPYKDEILYIEWLQFIAFTLYMEMKEYANSKGVLLMGDIPFYVGFNSSDCWANQDDFVLDENDEPKFVAGVPPDYFSKDGQRWGNPIYDWEFMKSEAYEFWFSRIRHAKKTFDILRIDHFRAFDTYYLIPSQNETARDGVWKNAPGREFFSLLKESDLNMEIIAEDLGDLFPSVLELRDRFNLPGMNVLEFTVLDKKVDIVENQVIYTGTHDNDTLVSWYKSLKEEEKELLEIVMRFKKMHGHDIVDKFINYAFESEARYVIIPLQDYLKLDNFYRMNTPGTFGSPNWEFRLTSLDGFKEILPKIKELVIKNNR